MKGMADDLRSLGETIIDRHLILNLLRGLNKRFDHMKIFIKRSQPFPSFHTVRNELKEIELDNSVAQGHASTFYSAPSGGGRPPPPLQQPPQEPPCPLAGHSSPTPTPTMATKARVRARDGEKERTIAPTTIARAATPQRGPPSTISGSTPSQFGQGCAFLNIQCIHRCTPFLMHRHTMAP
jgi:hypothetical protein